MFRPDGLTVPEAVACSRPYLRRLLDETLAGPRLVRRLQMTPLDANYRRVRQTDDLGSWEALSTVVHASGCASLLLSCCTELTLWWRLGQTPAAGYAGSHRQPSLSSQMIFSPSPAMPVVP